jgi:uncharacterized membrane protein
MGDFESNKTLTAIGSILLLIPGVNIVGLILIFLGMKGLSEYYNDDSIFRNLIIGGICGVIGTILSVFALVSVWGAIAAVFTSFGGLAIGVLLLSLVLAIVGFVCMLLMAIHFKRSLNALADHSGVQLFRTAGTLLFIGAILTIIFIGIFLVFLGYIILAVAFFSLKPKPNTSPSYSYTPPPTMQPPPTTQTSANPTSNFCPNCGTAVSLGATFCAHCGKQI